MESRLCSVFSDLLADLVRRPLASLSAAIVVGSPELNKIISEHFHGCEDCQKLLDELKFSESWTGEAMMRVMSVLMGVLSLDTGDTMTSEEVRQAQEDDDAPVREAVQDFIAAFPELSLDKWGLGGSDFQVCALYGAVEGISSLLGRYARMNLKKPETEFLLRSNGDVFASDEVAISKDGLFLEIARSAELWVYPDGSDSLNPSRPDNQMVGKVFNWLKRALKLKPDLLPRYFATSSHSHGVWGLTLRCKNPDEWDDSLDRWRSASAD